MTTFGSQLRAARLANGFSLRLLGDALKVTHSTIKAWEDGRTIISDDHLAKVCDFLDMDPGAARAARASDRERRDELTLRRHAERLAARRARSAA